MVLHARADTWPIPSTKYFSFPSEFLQQSGQQHRWTHWVSSATTKLHCFFIASLFTFMYLLKNSVIMVLSWLFLCFLCGLIIVETAPSNETWDLNSQKGIMRGQNLRLMKIQHPTNSLHTCYREECSGSHCTSQGLQLVREFCYPAILITGLPKCGTSAMYDLLTKLPGVITMHEKENCPFTRRRAHHMYFHSLPEVSQVQANSIIIDGCIDVVNNMKMRLLLREPDTYYLVWCLMVFNKCIAKISRLILTLLHAGDDSRLRWHALVVLQLLV